MSGSSKPSFTGRLKELFGFWSEPRNQPPPAAIPPAAISPAELTESPAPAEPAVLVPPPTTSAFAEPTVPPHQFTPPLAPNLPQTTPTSAPASLNANDPYESPANPADDDLHEDWVRLRKPWPTAARALLVIAVLATGLGTAAFAANSWMQNLIDPPGPPGAEVAVEIPLGASVNDIAVILANRGVVANATFARREWGGKGPFEAGDYTFQKNMSLAEAEAVLLGGPIINPGISLTIPEGLWLSEIRSRLLDALPEFTPLELSAALNGGDIRSQFQPADSQSLEGLLFPDTYQVGEDDRHNEADLVRRMVEQADLVLTELGYQDALAQVGYDPYQVIIIASMIEEEAKVAQDRAKIARVIYNRLERDMMLGIDATVLYALGRHTAELTVSELDIDSPYNTRKYKGLPPTPIAAPGRAALEAALNPADGDWLYYVLASADGSHFFTPSYEDFLDQVAKSRQEGLF